MLYGCEQCSLSAPQHHQANDGAVRRACAPQAPDAVSTTAEMQDKFSAGNIMLKYGSLSVFFGGLEAKIGSPSANARKAMEEEHTKRDDSHVKLTTGNYGMTTTSAIEWLFVATPDKPPEEGFPVEEKLRAARAPTPVGQERSKGEEALIASGAQPRVTMTLEKMGEELEARANTKLRGLGEPEVSVDEGVGARLYTGPLFVKCAHPQRPTASRTTR